MNKIILTLLLTTVFALSANAQNCVNSSRCDELGYTKTTTDCAGLDTLVCPFDENKVFCVFSEKSCEVGDILYENKKCYVKAIDGKTAIGIVFDTEKRLAMALDEATLEWGGYGKEIGSAARGTSGKSNTAAILAYGEANNIKYPAAEYCNKYSTSGTNAGDWFLPSMEEFESLAANYIVVNEKLMTIAGKTTISEKSSYWSSSELSNYSARRQVPLSGDPYYSDDLKTNVFRVRPVLAF